MMITPRMRVKTTTIVKMEDKLTKHIMNYIVQSQDKGNLGTRIKLTCMSPLNFSRLQGFDAIFERCLKVLTMGIKVMGKALFITPLGIARATLITLSNQI